MRVRAKRLELPSREEFLRFVEETNGRRGGYAGGQAEYLRVPHADVGPIKIESGLPDEKVLFLSDIFPTGYMAAENAEIEPGRYGGDWGMRPGLTVCDPERLDVRCGTRDRNRSRGGASCPARAISSFRF